MGRAASGFFDALAEARHEALFGDERLGITRLPPGYRAEDVTGHDPLEGFVSIAECATRMKISEEEVLALTRSGYLLSRWHHGRLLVRPGVL